MNKNHAVVSYIVHYISGDKTKYSMVTKEEYQLALIPMKVVFESDSFNEVCDYFTNLNK
jgi:hypothetical protein